MSHIVVFWFCLQAFIIGWTSDFVPRLVYQVAVSKDNTLHGYVNSSLSYFDVRDFQEQSVPRPEILSEEFANVTQCRYVFCVCLVVMTVVKTSLIHDQVSVLSPCVWYHVVCMVGEFMFYFHKC